MTDYAARWHASGISTYVLGLPGSEAASTLLDDIARAGGTGKHQSPGTPKAFEEAVSAALR